MNSSDGLTYWHLTVAYDGSNYSGWQVQPRHKTVQGELLQRLRLLLRDPELRIYGSSRTDAGVHALDQQVSFAAVMPQEFTPQEFAEKLNRWLPDDIVINNARVCPEPFNARYDNAGKAYTYCIAPGKKINPLCARFVWRTPRPLDLPAMRETARHLVGMLDFASFGVNPGRELDSTIRNIHRLEILEQDGLYYVNILGESFLYKMVRSITGYLVHVGLGHACPDDALAVLAGRERSLAADSAPAQGLFLAKVFFAPEEWREYQPVLPPFRLLAEA
ncbi:MAG: tRNA pseudouridine(38-40) synthase TruA [Oligosphaeraceae bacterium]|nr:tRNA pseudouridine(38-40) synthase TruA [Oligosphaeraceae bacterium]